MLITILDKFYFIQGSMKVAASTNVWGKIEEKIVGCYLLNSF